MIEYGIGMTQSVQLFSPAISSHAIAIIFSPVSSRNRTVFSRPCVRRAARSLGTSCTRLSSRSHSSLNAG